MLYQTQTLVNSLLCLLGRTNEKYCRHRFNNKCIKDTAPCLVWNGCRASFSRQCVSCADSSVSDGALYLWLPVFIANALCEHAFWLWCALWHGWFLNATREKNTLPHPFSSTFYQDHWTRYRLLTFAWHSVGLRGDFIVVAEVEKGAQVSWLFLFFF